MLPSMNMDMVTVRVVTTKNVQTQQSWKFVCLHWIYDYKFRLFHDLICSSANYLGIVTKPVHDELKLRKYSDVVILLFVQLHLSLTL